MRGNCRDRAATPIENATEDKSTSDDDFEGLSPHRKCLSRQKAQPSANVVG